MNKQEMLDMIEKKSDEIKELKRKIEQTENKKDYSKFVGRNDGILAVKGDIFLKSWSDDAVDLRIDKSNKSAYICPLNYEIVPQLELKEGDVVCFYPEQETSELHISNFGVFIGTDDDGDFIYQILLKRYDRERVTSETWKDGNRKVVRFLRC